MEAATMEAAAAPESASVGRRACCHGGARKRQSGDCRNSDLFEPNHFCSPFLGMYWRFNKWRRCIVPLNF
jgi:hypothetical protein